MIEALPVLLLLAAPSLEAQEEACTSGDSKACDAAAELLEKGKGAPKDVARAAMLRVRSARLPPPCPECREACGSSPAKRCHELCDAGSVVACSAIAHAAMVQTQGAEHEKALAMLEDAAARHEAAAMGTLGLLYISGQGRKKDALKGARLLGGSCALQYWSACNTLALAYEKGEGVPRDAKLAGAWYEAACEGSYSRSCMTGGELFEKGLGVVADKARALKLYQAGCRLGVDSGCAAVNRLQAAGAIDTPVSAADEEQLLKMEKAVAPYIAQARKTWPDVKKRFNAGLPDRHVLYVTTMLRDAEKHAEQVFVMVRRAEDATIYGVLTTDIEVVKGYRRGDKIAFPEKELRDWTIVRPDGSEEGNVVGKFLDTYRP